MSDLSPPESFYFSSDSQGLPVFDPTLRPPQFGKDVAKAFWAFDKGWHNLNHGSFGTCPKPVLQAFRAWQDQSEASPDKFLFNEASIIVNKIKVRLSQLVGCDADDLVFVTNATSALDAVLRCIEWKKNDYILYFSSFVYDGCRMVLHYAVDSHSHLNLKLLNVDITAPISEDDFINQTHAVISHAKKDGKNIRVALFDSISSKPGILLPWQRLCKLFAGENIISIVDAAHSIGQERINLSEVKPDFWFSNMHKWLYAHRSVALLYVDKKHQAYTHSFPVSYGYTKAYPGITKDVANRNFQNAWSWGGTQDMSGTLSITTALEFRNWLGGEEAIMEYNSSLAQNAAEKVSEILGTEVLEAPRTINMVNVRLPLEVGKDERSSVMLKRIAEELVTKHSTYLPVYQHDGKAWVRLSAQVYNELDEFEEAGRALKEICAAFQKSA